MAEELRPAEVGTSKPYTINKESVGRIKFGNLTICVKPGNFGKFTREILSMVMN